MLSYSNYARKKKRENQDEFIKTIGSPKKYYETRNGRLSIEVQEIDKYH